MFTIMNLYLDLEIEHNHASQQSAVGGHSTQFSKSQLIMIIIAIDHDMIIIAIMGI